VQRILNRRGGWRRLAIILGVILFIILAIALGVGLGVGLTQHNNSKKNTSSSTSSAPSTPTGPFPIGAYAITAFLTNTSTACTSNTATWSCYPYTTYSTSATGSESTYNWYITASSTNPNNYQISSQNNSFSSVVFTNSSLTLTDANTQNERYTFSIPHLVKSVVPAVSISNDNTLSTCFYNSTTLTASLYTRMNATLTDSNGAQPTGMTMQSEAAGDGIVFNKPWPGAVMIEQTANAGNEVPNCYRNVNAKPDFAEPANVPAVTGGGGECSCLYMDYGDGSGGS